MGWLTRGDNELWAARLCISSRGLRKLVQSTTGTGIKNITHRMAIIADKDKFREMANMRRSPVPRGHQREFLPGNCFEYDVWGPAGAPSINGGAKYDLHALCVATGFAHAIKSRNHTAHTVLQFIGDIVNKERSYGHEMQIIRMDRAPEHESDEMREGLRALGVVLELTPRNHHEGVGRAEGGGDTTQRMAEAYTMRAALTLGYILDARMHAWVIRNFRCASGRAHTRREEHTGLRPDFTRSKPYLFGTRCLVLQDESARGSKGSLSEPRSIEGVFIGLEGASYLVYLLNGAGVVRQRSIKPLNERALMLRGMPPAVVIVDNSAQTDAKAPEPAEPAPRHFPKRTPIETGAPPELIGPPSMHTRAARAQQQRVLTFIADHLELAENNEDLRSKYNAAVYQLMGDETAEATHWDGGDSIDAAMQLLELQLMQADSTSPPDEVHGAYKASKTKVQIKTPLGMREEIVPSSCRQVREHPRRLEWEKADDKAKQVLLREGNKMVRPDSIEAKGATLVHAIVQRKIKLDADTGELAKHDAYKSRICVDGRRLRLSMEALGIEPIRPMHAQVADDMTIKMLHAKIAAEHGTTAKIDIVNAYAKGTRGPDRSYVLIRLPESVREYDEDGVELYMLGIKPMQGEVPSGDEWWAHINASITSFGIPVAECVAGLYSATIDGATIGIALITDDFFVGEWGASPDFTITRRLRDHLKAIYKDIKYEEMPTAFTAYKLMYQRKLGLVTFSMPQKTLDAVYEHLPELPKGKRPSASLNKGETLERMADALRLPPLEERHAKLDKEQKETQEIIGSLKYIDKVRPDLTLSVHRLSCVMSYPPKEAIIVARLVLEKAYDGRNNGITYGGAGDAATSTQNFDIHKGAPAKLQGSADATWNMHTDLCGIVVTMFGGAIYHGTKKIQAVLQSSMETEGYATSEVGKAIQCAREIALALGIDLGGPTPCGTDNKSNLQVSTGTGAANRSRHCLRRFLVFRQRVQEGSVTLEHVRDENHPADFLTKWLPAKKFKLSMAYATNSNNAVKDITTHAMQK